MSHKAPKVNDRYTSLLKLSDTHPSEVFYCHPTSIPSTYFTKDGYEIDSMFGKIKRIYSFDDIAAMKNQHMSPFKGWKDHKFTIEILDLKTKAAYRYGSTYLAAEALGLRYGYILETSRRCTVISNGNSNHGLRIKRHWDLAFPEYIMSNKSPI